jgi:hypothetical protein
LLTNWLEERKIKHKWQVDMPQMFVERGESKV